MSHTATRPWLNGSFCFSYGNTLSAAGTLLFVLCAGSTAQTIENSKIAASSIVASSFINDHEGWLADDSARLFYTKNSGETWDSIFLTKNFVKLDFTDALSGYALSADAAYATSDGGSTWTSLSLPGPVGYGLHFTDAKDGIISGLKEIYKTADGGLTWTSISTGAAWFSDYHFTSSSVGLAAAHSDSYECIWRTADGGLTWSNVFSEPNYSVKAVWFADQATGWAAGGYDHMGLMEPVILKTTDGGLTWKKIYHNSAIDGRGESLIDIRFKSEWEGYAVSRHNYDVYTLDGGETWTLTYASNLPGIQPEYGIYRSLDGFGNLFMVGQSGQVTKW